MAEAKLYDEGLTKKRLNKSNSDEMLLKAISNAEKHMRSLCLVDVVKASAPSTAAEVTDGAGASAAAAAGAGGGDPSQPSTSGADAAAGGEGEAGGSGQQPPPPTPQLNLTTAEHQNRIVYFVQSGNAEGHLGAVFRGTVESTYQQGYLKSLQTEDRYLPPVGFGPIIEEELQDALYEYCSKLYKDTFENADKSIPDYVSYVLNVFIPEVRHFQ